MKNLLKKLEDVQSKMQEKVDKREETYDGRSWEWQESDKGETYSDKTYQLQESLDAVEQAIEDLEAYLED